MKYKPLDKVRIKSLDWYNKNKNNRNEITFENNPHWRFVANQSDYCGQIATIISVSKTAYRLENIPWNWTDEMIEGLVEEESEKKLSDESWKPSKEEMDVLYGLAYLTNQYDEHKEEIITRLYQDLKREFFNGSSYENMFPDTEDDVRRRSTIQVLEYARSLDNYNQYGKEDIDKNIAWLEKQGKKPQGKSALEAINEKNIDNQNCVKPTNKVEPKFHIGDWATDGDVLAEDSCIFIIQKLGDNGTAAKTYCALHNDGYFEDGSILYFDIDSTKPATEEEKQKLFKAIKDNGYKWNSETKTLEKLIEPLDVPTMTTEFVKEHGLPCPEGYIFKDENGNVINATKIVLEKKTNKEMVENNTKVDMGEVSDGYHTFNELYEYRMLYNAALFNEFAKQGLYDVHKSRKHSDGECPFGDSNWFIVMAELPTGQISNHYEMKDWDKFQIPEKPLANKWDEHSPRDVAERLTSFTTPKKEYPKTYEECCKVLGYDDRETYCICHTLANERLFEALYRLKVCRDAYWKLHGEEMGLGKPWEPDWTYNGATKYCIGVSENEIQNFSSSVAQYILAFPTEEMRDAFKENFDPDIEICKEFL